MCDLRGIKLFEYGTLMTVVVMEENVLLSLYCVVEEWFRDMSIY